MSQFRTFVLALTGAAAAFAATPSLAQNGPRDQDRAYFATREGRIIPLRLIEGRIVPAMRGFTYLGPELSDDTSRYRLKFLRGPKLVWIDVDARTGEVIGRSR